jgi:hypothetical protein
LDGLYLLHYTVAKRHFRRLAGLLPDFDHNGLARLTILAY